MGVDLSRGPTAQCQMMDKKCWWYDFLPWHFFSWISGETKKNLLHPHFTGEHICRSVVWIKLQRNFIEITLWHGYSPVNSLHIFRTTFNKNTSRGLLLDSKISHIFSLLFCIWLYCVIEFNFINDYIKQCEKILGTFCY